MSRRYLFSYMLLFLSVVGVVEVKAQKLVKWEKSVHEKPVMSAPLSKDFKLSFKVDNYQNFELVLRGNGDNARQAGLFMVAFKHYELSIGGKAFGNSHKMPYQIGDIITLEYNSGLLQVMINGHKVYTTAAVQETPERIIYKSTEHQGTPPQINLIK